MNNDAPIGRPNDYRGNCLDARTHIEVYQGAGRPISPASKRRELPKHDKQENPKIAIFPREI